MRGQTRTLVGIVALALLFLLSIILTRDFLDLLSLPQRKEFSTHYHPGTHSFKEEVHLSSLVASTSPPELRAHLQLKIQGTLQEATITSAACSLWSDPKTQHRTWFYLDDKTDGITVFDILDENGVRVPSWELKRDVTFPLTAPPNTPITYPFDEYEAAISPRCCINPKSTSEPCDKAQPARVTNFQINYGVLPLAPNLLPTVRRSNGDYVISLKRLPLLKVISIALLFLSLLFLGYMISVPKGDDLVKGSLGYFGALWALRGLIVPKDITVFPTVIDYGVIVLFFTLFLGIFAKTMLQQKGEDNHAPEKSSSRKRRR